DVVASGGEIVVLDPAGYGALTIMKSISIQGHGFAGLAVPSGDGITISAGADARINLRGLLLDGVGTGSNGIVLNSGLMLNVQDSVIRGFTGNGISFVPTVASVLLVSNTLLSANALSNGQGVLVAPPSGSAVVQAVLDHVQIDNGSGPGLAA